MLWPSTRATWKPKVTISTAYTAAETSVFTQAVELFLDLGEPDAGAGQPQVGTGAPLARQGGGIERLGVAVGGAWRSARSPSPTVIRDGDATVSGTPGAGASASG